MPLPYGGRFPGRLLSRPPLIIRPYTLGNWAIPVEDPPAINSVTNTIVGTNQTSHVIAMYGRVVLGDLLIGICGVSGTATPTVTWPGGWAVINVPATGTTFLMSVAYKFAGASEAGFTLTTAQLATSVTRILQVKGAHATSPPECGVEVANVGTTPNPPTLDPVGWSGENTLWIPVVAIASTSGAVSAYPASYIGSVGVISANGVTLAHAHRANVVDAEDPGAFTSSPSTSYRTTTIGVRPAPGTARLGNFLAFT